MLYSSLYTAFSSAPNANDAHLALKLSLINTLNYAVSSLCGLVTGPLCDLLGVRLLAAAALLFATAGSFVCILAADRSLVLWIVGYGVLVAISTSLYEVSRPVVLRHHFQRHYGLSNGILGVGYALTATSLSPVWEAILSFGYVGTEHPSSPNFTIASISGQSLLATSTENSISWSSERRRAGQRAQKVSSVTHRLFNSLHCRGILCERSSVRIILDR